jgi:hypothetical protein
MTTRGEDVQRERVVFGSCFIECGFDFTNRLAEVRQRVLESTASHMFIRTSDKQSSNLRTHNLAAGGLSHFRKDIELSPFGLSRRGFPQKLKDFAFPPEMQASRVVPLASAPGRLRGAVFHNPRSLRCAKMSSLKPCGNCSKHGADRGALRWHTYALVVYAQAQWKGRESRRSTQPL